MSNGQRMGLSPLTVYTYSLGLKLLWIALSGPVVALISLPIFALQRGEGQLFHAVNLFDLSLRLALYVSLALLAALFPVIIWSDLLGKKRVDWKELSQRAQRMGRGNLWHPKKLWSAVEDCRQMTTTS